MALVVVLWKREDTRYVNFCWSLLRSTLWRESLQKDVFYRIHDQAPTAATRAPMAQNYQASHEMATLYAGFESYTRLNRMIDIRGMKRDRIMDRCVKSTEPS